MSYLGLNTSGGLNPCIVFYQRMVSCLQRENLPSKMCSIEGLDYLECVNRKKQHALNFKVSLELHKNSILELPTYDEENDVFVNKYENATAAFKH